MTADEMAYRQLMEVAGEGAEDDGSAFFSPYRLATDPGFAALVADLAHDLREIDHASLAVLLSNLLGHSLRGKLTRVSLRKANPIYRDNSYLNPHRVRYEGVKAAIESLEKAGLLQMVRPGWLDRHTGRGRQTRVKATAELVEEWRAYGCYNWPALYGSATKQPLVVLREDDRQMRDLSGSKTAREVAKLVSAYNDALSDAEIVLPPGVPGTDYSHLGTRRVFNGAFTRGGRFYAPWQNLPKLERARVTIDGAPVAEPDYRAAQLHLAYALAGARMPAHLQADPYMLPGFEPQARDALKKAFIFAINASSRRLASAALRHCLEKSQSGIDPEQSLALLKRFEKEHAPIAALLYRGMWARLHAEESRISEAVIAQCLRRGIVPLNVHDSNVVKASDAAEVAAIMREAPVKLLGYAMPVKEG